MMKIQSAFSTVLIAVAMCLAISSCSRLSSKWGKPVEPSGTTVMKQFPCKDIHGILAAKGIVVHYSPQSAPYAVRLEGPENVVAALKMKESRGVLSLEVTEGDRVHYDSDSLRLHVWISTPDVRNFQAMIDARIEVEALDMHGKVSAEAFTGGAIRFTSVRADKFQVNAYTSAEITVDSLSARTCDIEAYTKAKIRVGGRVSHLSITSYTGADVDVSRLAQSPSPFAGKE